MSWRPIPWDLYETFLMVMKEGSLSGAARAQKTAQPTVRRQIESLEEILGCVLFTRSATGLVPTEAARRSLPYAETMASTADAFVRVASGPEGEIAGIVRITCSEVVGAEVLPPMLAELLSQYPRLEIEVASTNETQDLLRRDADIAIRMSRPAQATLVIKKIGEIELGLFANDTYFRGRAIPCSPKDLLQGHVLIGSDQKRVMESHLRNLDLQELRFAYRTDSDLAQLGAIRGGVGIGVCQAPLAHGLRRVLPEIRFGMETFIVMHEDLRRVARVRGVFDHLVRAFTAYVRKNDSET